MLKIRVYILILIATVFYPVFLLLFKHTLRASKKESLRILIIPQFTRIGDLVCTTPVFRAIKEKYPRSFLAVAVNRKIAGVIKNNPSIDEIFHLEDREYLDFFGVLRRFKRVRDKHFDVSVNVNTSAIGTLLSVYGGIPQRIKIIHSRRPIAEIMSDWMNTSTLKYKEGERIPTLYIRTLQFLGIDPTSVVKKEVFTAQEDEAKAKNFLQKNGISSNDLVVGISVTAGNEIKEWGLDKFAGLAKKLIEDYKAKVVFIGSPKDEGKISIVNRQLEGKGIVATKEFSISELPSLIKQFSIFISADTGPMHIAHAVGVPLIDIVGPVDPMEQAPLEDKKAIVVTPPPNIKPTIFALRPDGDPKESRRAADSIIVDDVIKAFDSLYSKIHA